MNLVTDLDSGGIPFCMNCVGWHPDTLPSIRDAIIKAHNPQKDVFNQSIQFEHKRLVLYANKSCALCGRTYKADGHLDETWTMTAKRVKMEFDNAGLFGVDDKMVEQVVAKGRKSVETLFRNRPQLLLHAKKTGDWFPMQKLTFSGTLAYIITVALEEKAKKNSAKTEIKGPLDAR